MYARNPKDRFLQPHQRYKISWLIFLATAVGQLGIDLYTPSMPSMQLALATTATNIKLTLSLYMLGAALFSLPFGFIADKYGRRPTLLIGYAGYLITTLIIIYIPNIHTLLICRFFQGAMVAAFGIVMRACYRDLYSSAELTKVTALISSAWGFIPILAPMLGGYIQHYFGWQMQFQTLLTITGVCACLTWQLLPEISADKNKLTGKQFTRALRISLTNSHLLLFALITALSTVPLMIYITFAPFLLQTTLHIPSVQFGWLSLLVAIFYMLGSMFTATMVKRIGNRRLISIMMLLSLIIAIAFLVISLLQPITVLTFILPNILLFFCLGAIYPTTASIAYQSIHQYTGVAAAIFGTVLVLTCSLAMGIVSLLPHNSAEPLAWLSLAGVVVMASLAWLSTRTCSRY